MPATEQWLLSCSNRANWGLSDSAGRCGGVGWTDVCLESALRCELREVLGASAARLAAPPPHLLNSVPQQTRW